MEDNIKFSEVNKEEKKRIIDKLHNNKKAKILFFIFSMTIIFTTYFPLQRIIERHVILNKYKDIEVVTSNNILYNIENIEFQKNKLLVSGWMFNVDTPTYKIQMFAKNLNTGELLVMDTREAIDNGISKYFDKDLNYENYCFSASIEHNKLIDDVCYEILMGITYIRDKNDLEMNVTRILSSAQYVYNDEVYRYNPIEFYEPQISDMELSEVIKDGQLRGFSKEERMWIYQYENFLYFMLDSNFGLLSEANICVPIMPRTTCVELLPEKRIQYGFDHLGSMYEDKTYEREGVIPYQVIKVELPTDYPMTYIGTGLYDVELKEWKHHFTISMTDWRACSEND